MPTPNPYQRRVTTVEEALQDYLAGQSFESGDRLPTEPELCEALGVSRTSLREAMHSLQSMGIVEMRRGQGAYLGRVALPQIADGITFWSRTKDEDGRHDLLLKITQVRRSLEKSLITEVVGLHTDDDFRALEECISEMDSAFSDHKRAWRADARFHQILYGPLDNWLVDDLLGSLWESARRIVGDDPSPKQLYSVGPVHTDIVEALRAADMAQVMDAMDRHFYDGMDEALETSMTPYLHDRDGTALHP